ncbi:hypothetical protein [uncultured Lacinutrix sp.]|uniref:hypothetical protein n=1 Tax=uncultured Lacinutrix sp. TaxID=574032 RepID=UPI00263315B2|nr:hypothetical protein [uncultured Lacinutrix sp.]
MERKLLFKDKLTKLELTLNQDKWLNYKDILTLKKTDSKILFDLLLEYDINSIEVYESSKKVTPIHIWRSICQIGNIEDFEKLLKVLIDIDNLDAVWLQLDFPKITSIYGVAVLSIIQQVFDDVKVDGVYKLCLLNSIKKLYHFDEDSNQKIRTIIKTFFVKYVGELDEEFVNYVLQILVGFQTDDFTSLLFELDEKEIINLNLILPEILDELIEQY